MKNFLKGLAAASMVLSLAACSSSEPASNDTKEEETKEETPAEPEKAVASYYIINNTGEAVDYSVVNNEGELKTVEGSLKDGKFEAVDFGEVNADLSFTVSYKTESGREGKFETLHVEEAKISLLAEDDMTGATQIAFVQELPKAKAAYKFVNATGESVTLTVENNEGQVDTFTADLADGEETNADFGEITNNLSFTVTYKTESGREGVFKTLHVEEVTIILLAEDDITGPTQILFDH